MSYKQLTPGKIYKIKALLQAGISKNSIADILGIYRSMVFKFA